MQDPLNGISCLCGLTNKMESQMEKNMDHGMVGRISELLFFQDVLTSEHSGYVHASLLRLFKTKAGSSVFL